MCCKAILEVLYNAGDWQQLNEHILLLAKRRSQLKQVWHDRLCSSSLVLHMSVDEVSSSAHLKTLLQAVQAFVRQAMEYVEKTPNKETKVELIKTLQSVTEGKVTIKSQLANTWPKLSS